MFSHLINLLQGQIWLCLTFKLPRDELGQVLNLDCIPGFTKVTDQFHVGIQQAILGNMPQIILIP